MTNEQLYPKDITKLFEKINFILKNEENQEKISNINNWKAWFILQKYQLEYVCKNNEFLKIYYDNNKYSLQVWKHDSNIDSIKFNLISNYYSEYDNELTKVII